MASIDNIYKPYVPAAKTNVSETLRRLGWEPPSQSEWFQEKWRTYRHLANINEENTK